MPIRVILMSVSGEMYTAWLPPSVEGRYKFLDSSGLDTLPFYIEAEANRWVAHAGKNARFFKFSPNGEEISIGQSTPLANKVFQHIRYMDKRFVIYAENEYPGDYTFIPYYLEEHTDYSIGQDESSEICYKNLLVSHLHAILHWCEQERKWEIISKGRNGTFVNGRRIQNTYLNNGDTIFIMGLYIIMGAGFVAINNVNKRVAINTPKIRRIKKTSDVLIPNVPTEETELQLFDRQPRRQFPIKPEPISIDMPPTPLSGSRIPLMLRLGSPLLMGGRALMTGNYLMAMTSMVLPALTQGLTEKDRKEYEAKRLKLYREYLEAKRTEIRIEKENEEKQLNENYPPVSAAVQFAVHGTRLWERRKTDEDFLSIRLGSGSVPMIAQKEYAPKRFELEPDELTEEMYALAEAPVLLDNAPVMLSLLRDYVVGVRGNHASAIDLFHRIVLQTVSTHSYDEVKIIILADEVDAACFDYIRYLPHCWSNDRSLRFFATSNSDVQQINKALSQEFDSTENNRAKYDVKNGVSFVVLALSKSLYHHFEPVHIALEAEEYAGLSVIAAFDGLPKECSKIIDIQETFRLVDFLHPEAEDIEFQLDPQDEDAVQVGLRKMMSTKLMVDSELFSLPGMITFLDMFGVGRVEHLSPIQRWSENNPVKSLAAPVGVGTDGSLFVLDLHEKRQGPHGLVAGMTGSGKSEFLITYILSMAVNYSPDEVAFVLIDYKGGGLADAFVDKTRGVHLPHVVGTITNLDGAAINRSLMSINSELKRRQEVFKRAKSETNEGTMDIYDYQKLYRAKRVSEPMPHLIIVSDEFAELKSQQPEFMNELISTARIGRSLGVHLILATQKPAGVVTDQIRSNTKFRVCLRVQDRTDSMDMLKRADAAEIKNTGRFYLQVGYNEFFAQGQSAWCGAEYVPQDEVVIEDHAVRFVDNVGQTVLNVKPPVRRTATGIKQIVAIVKYLSDLAAHEGIVPRRMWLDPLPAKLDLDGLRASVSDAQGGDMSVLLGLVDDPEKQKQFPLFLKLMENRTLLLCGSAGTGKSTVLRTMLLGLTERYGPDELQYYILDLSAGALSHFGSLPHCGAYITDRNEGDFDRLLDLMAEIIEERKRLFAEVEVTNFEAYRKIEPLPMILLIIDGFTNIKNLKKGSEYYNNLHEYLRAAANYGIRYILTCNHIADVNSKTRQEINCRLALQAKDRFEYADILDVRCTVTPPVMNGRGFCVFDDRPLEYQAAMLKADASEQSRAASLRSRIAEIADRYPGASPVKRLTVLMPDQEYADFCSSFEPGRIPLGYATKDLRRISLPFQQTYSMSFYFGNPIGVKPVLRNLVTAGRHNRMDLIVVRRKEDSVFDNFWEKSCREEYPGTVTVLDSTAEGIAALTGRLEQEIAQRNVYRDEYCREHGIPETDKGRAKKAARHIRAHTKPLLVIMEGFGDLCRQEKDEDTAVLLTAFLSRTNGYNFYFAGCFYPGEENLSGDPLMKAFNREELLLLFGGRYDKCMVSLPMDIRKIEQINPLYDRYVLKYRGYYYTMIMPCGPLDAGATDPDEAPIIN